MNETVKTLLSLPTMSIADAAQVLGVTVLSIKTAIRCGDLATFKVGKRPRVRTASVRKLLQMSEVSA
jgi:excisionase family DNA binding protein